MQTASFAFVRLSWYVYNSLFLICQIAGQVRIIFFFFPRFSVKRSVFHSTRNYKSSEEDAYYAEISLKGFLKSEICHIFENSEHSGRKIQWNGSSPVDRIFPFDQKSGFHLTPFRKFNNFRILRKLSRKFRTICACFESSEILE